METIDDIVDNVEEEMERVRLEEEKQTRLAILAAMPRKEALGFEIKRISSSNLMFSNIRMFNRQNYKNPKCCSPRRNSKKNRMRKIKAS